MAKMKTTKKSLLLSVLSLVICCSMLLGTTFAWFTDSVSSANNIIMSGNLDVTLEYWNGTAWVTVDNASDILTNELWEPGVTEVAYFRIANAGSLALKYQFGINIVSETEGVNVAGETFKLSDYIQFGVVENVNGKTGAYADREAAVAAVTDAKKISAGYTKAGAMESGAELYLALVVYMPETVGNEANHNGTNVPEIKLGIDIFATQYTFEEDSFGTDYDKGAPWTGLVDIDWYLDNPDATEYVLTSAEELAGLAAIVNGTATAPATTYAAGEAATTVQDNFKGQTIKLGANIDLNEIAWTPIGDNPNPFLGNFDGQDYTVSNLYVNNEGWSGLIGHAGKSAGSTVKNVTIDGATILSNRMAGAVVGQIYGSIDNCHVKNATIIATPNAVGDSYDNGDKVGGIVGWLGDNGTNRTLSNCSATNVELGGYRDIGGIVGYVASSTTVKDNAVSDVTITVDQSTNYYGDKDVNAGYVCGRVNGTITEENNTSADSVVDSTYSKNGLTLKGDGDGNVVLYLVPETYEGTTLNVPEGITAIGGYAFAYNTNIEEIVLPSTVTTLNDRAFRDTSASTVVLNEGLTNISYQAFRNASNVKEVVIPSTVTTISKEAFQNSGITALTIPASVTTLEYGACRDMKELTSVVIEGNVDIPVYAFRACTKLESVLIKGEDVTFGGGSKGMIFTNKENGDGSAITVTVVSEAVQARLLAADTAAKDFGGYIIIVDDGFEKVESVEDLLEALANATAGTKINANGLTVDINSIGTEVSGGKKEYTIPGGVTLKNLTFTGAYRGGNYIFFGGTPDQKIVFENCTFDSGRTMGFGFLGQEGSVNSVEYNNCTFKGVIIAEFPGNPNGVATYNDCTFTRPTFGNSYVMTKGGTHLFNGCTFDYTGATQSNIGIADTCCINVTSESDGSDETVVVLNGCTRINCGTRTYGDKSTLAIK